jgi:predicted acetyltransferase
MVSVLPTHRRRGIMSKMIEAHLQDVRAHNEPLAAVWASESEIYGRFGFGTACQIVSVELDKEFAQMQGPKPTEAVYRLIDLESEADLLYPLHESVCKQRPGAFSRWPAWWQHRIVADPEFRRGGASKLRCAIIEGSDGAEAYTFYRTKLLGGTLSFHKELQIVELMAPTVHLEKLLWHYLFGVDLIVTISAWNLPADHLLKWWLKDPRKLRSKLSDSLWLRIIDVPHALSARHYSSIGELVIEIQDDLYHSNHGRFWLSVDQDSQVVCEKTTRSPHISMNIRELGSLYLGGFSAIELHRAGLIAGNPTSIKLAHDLFQWHVAPWCFEIF